MTQILSQPAAEAPPLRKPVAAAQALPKLGFLGVGWIGAARLRAVAEAGAAQIAAIADVDPRPLDAVRPHAPEAAIARSLPELLEMDVDGIVIATPSGLHAEQAIAALSRQVAVFCQKPLGATAPDTRRVLQCARENDALLGVDLCYRHLQAYRRAAEMIRAGAIGEVFSVELVFHNAYAPDKGWAFDPLLAGGGCVIDLGTHLIDLALEALQWPRIVRVESHLMARGRRLCCDPAAIEDYATALMWTERDQSVRLACSWNFHAGQDAAIEATFHGEQGSLSVHNVGGSFYTFAATLRRGAHRDTLCEGPDDWQAGPIVQWARQLGEGAGFDRDLLRTAEVAAIIDRIYQR